MKVALITSFQTWFLQRHIYPQFKRRGIEIVLETTAKRIGRVNLEGKGIEMVLHMTEVGSHSDSYKLAEACRKAGIPLRPLSRKKASWDILPPPIEIVAEDVHDVPHPAFASISPAEDAARAEPAVPVPVPAPAPAPSEPQPMSYADLKDLTAMYEAENADLRKKLDELTNDHAEPSPETPKVVHEPITEGAASHAASGVLSLHSLGLVTDAEAIAIFGRLLKITP